ncbi:MAG: holo-ACP synthase [Bdellovibrionota bacterium]
MMNIGCDIENVETFRKKWKDGDMKFFEKIFSVDEIDYCSKFKDPFTHFAARFCAKEAVVKAANEYCKLVISDVQIVKNKNGAPEIKPWKKRKSTENFFSKHRIMVSLSHTSDMAMACVLIQKR